MARSNADPKSVKRRLADRFLLIATSSHQWATCQCFFVPPCFFAPDCHCHAAFAQGETFATMLASKPWHVSDLGFRAFRGTATMLPSLHEKGMPLCLAPRLLLSVLPSEHRLDPLPCRLRCQQWCRRVCPLTFGQGGSPFVLGLAVSRDDLLQLCAGHDLGVAIKVVTEALSTAAFHLRVRQLRLMLRPPIASPTLFPFACYALTMTAEASTEPCRCPPRPPGQVSLPKCSSQRLRWILPL